MSKQMTNKAKTNGRVPAAGSSGKAPAVGATKPGGPSGRTGPGPAAGRPAPGATGNRPAGQRPGQPGMTAQQRVAARQAAARKKQGGFRLRPMDIGLIIAGVIVVGLIVFAGISNFGSTQTNPGTTANPTDRNTAALAPGTVAPDFSLQGPDGKTYKLSDYKGKVVLLELFAPWCPHCQDDVPMMNQVYDAYKDKGVEFLGVSASPYGRDYEDKRAANQEPSTITMDDVSWFKTQFGVKFPLVLDPPDASKNLKVANDYAVAFYPTIYVIGKDGKISSQVAGNYVLDSSGQPQNPPDYTPLTPDKINAALDAALK